MHLHVLFLRRPSSCPPVHGIDNGPDDRLFCLELMTPNGEMFAEYVRSGLLDGYLSDEDLCTLMAEECGYAAP